MQLVVNARLNLNVYAGVIGDLWTFGHGHMNLLLPVLVQENQHVHVFRGEASAQQGWF